MEKTYTNNGGRKIWKNQNGQLHRIDGPAATCSNGSKFWYQYGRLHRLDGPAEEYADGTKTYWINGSRVFPLLPEFEKIIKKIEKYGK